MPEIQVIDDGYQLVAPAGKNITLQTSGTGKVIVTGDVDAELQADITGDVTGNVAGNLTGYQTFGTATPRTGADAPNLVIDPASRYVSLTKGSAGAYTLAAPGAENVGNRMVIIAGSAFAHVVTVTGGAGGDTLTFTAAIGAAVELLAVSATVWGFIGLGGAVLSTA